MKLQLPQLRWIQARARTQSSIAVSANGQDWLLVNASPDVLAQTRASPELQPARAVRDSGIAAVLLMDAQIDHVTRLLMLREHASPLPLLAMPEVLSDLGEGFPITCILPQSGPHGMIAQLDRIPPSARCLQRMASKSPGTAWT